MNTQLSDGIDLLIIGYGNPLRGDDAAGYSLAVALEGKADRNTRVLAVHQLTPDLSAALAETRHVVFVDSFPATDAEQKLRVINLAPYREPLEAGRTESVTSHSASPQALLALCAQLYGVTPSATLICIPAFDFALGGHISIATNNKMNEARDTILQRMFQHA